MSILINLDKYDIILASASPRRKELLGGLDIDFRIEILPDIDESFPDDILPEEVALTISEKKAEAYQSLLTENTLIITADTVVIVDDKILGKPKSKEDAFNMLKELSNRTHSVVTGVTISTLDKDVSFSVSTDVEFAELTDDEINYYIDKYKPFDKAGAYGIQEWIGYIGIKNIVGSFYNVMGLPVQRLYTELKRF